MPSHISHRRPLGTHRFDPAVPVLRQTSGRLLPDVQQPLKTARRAGL